MSIQERIEKTSAYEIGYKKGLAIGAQQAMDEMGDHAQEVIRLKDIIVDINLKLATAEHSRDNWEKTCFKLNDCINEKAKAWDDLEALVSECNSNRFDLKVKFNHINVCRHGNFVPFFSEEFSKEAVSNALESIKGTQI